MEEIKNLIYAGKVDDAIQRLNAYIQEHPESDEAYYLLIIIWKPFTGIRTVRPRMPMIC